MRESLIGKAANAASSISIPVETNSPVREHIMVTDAKIGFPVFHPRVRKRALFMGLPSSARDIRDDRVCRPVGAFSNLNVM